MRTTFKVVALLTLPIWIAPAIVVVAGTILWAAISEIIDDICEDWKS